MVGNHRKVAGRGLPTVDEQLSSEEERLGGVAMPDPTRKIRYNHKITAYLLGGAPFIWTKV